MCNITLLRKKKLTQRWHEAQILCIYIDSSCSVEPLYSVIPGTADISHESLTAGVPDSNVAHILNQAIYA